MYTPAHEKPVKLRILLGIAGPTGSGKTYSAMTIAQAIAGDQPFAVLDTENDRALHYRRDFRFDHGSLQPPFRPDRYADGIEEAAKAGYRVIVIDQASYLWNGEGGLLDWHEEELQRMAGDDWKKRERCAMAAWIKPKQAHKRLVQQLLRTDLDAVILCLRAEEKTMPLKDPQTGKMVPTNVGFQMICEKNLPYELTVALMMSAGAPGTYDVIKCTKHLQGVFDGKQISERVGRKLVAWSTEGSIKEHVERVMAGEEEPPQVENPKLETALGLIEGATTKESLTAVGNELAAFGLTGAERTKALRAYKERMGALG